MVLDELRRIGLAALELAHVLQTIEEHQLPAGIETHRVAGMVTLFALRKLDASSWPFFR